MLGEIDYYPIVAFFYNEIYVFAMVSRHGLIHSLHLDDPRFPVIVSYRMVIIFG